MWGRNEAGQLGAGNSTSLLIPRVQQFSITKAQIRWVAAGQTHAVAITNKGQSFTWGQGSEGQLGLGKSRLSSSTPYIVTKLLKEKLVTDDETLFIFLLLTFVPVCGTTRFAEQTSISCGANHNLGVNSKGEVFSWGRGSDGQLGHGDQEHQFYPKKVLLLTFILGPFHCFAKSSDSAFSLGSFPTLDRVLGEGRCASLPAGCRIETFSSTGRKHSRCVLLGMQRTGRPGHRTWHPKPQYPGKGFLFDSLLDCIT